MKVWMEFDQKSENDSKKKSEDKLDLDEIFKNLFKVYFAKGFNI